MNAVAHQQDRALGFPDQLRFELELLQVRGMMCKMSGVAKVDGEIVCEAEMGAMVRDK